MPSALRAQVALMALVAVLLIPIGTSSLRGLTHVLTCQDASTTPFSVAVPEVGAPTISSSTVIERAPDGSTDRRLVCGGLRLDLTMGSADGDRAEVTLAIANESDLGWRGSVQLQLGDISIPVDIGDIDAGTTATDTIDVRLQRGETYEVDGTLLIGP